MNDFKRQKERFFLEREKVKKLHLKQETGFSVAEKLKNALDTLLIAVFKEIFGGWDIPIAMYAVGGYGRGELNFFSDIDINLIYDGKLKPNHQSDIESFYYFLLSLNLDVGFSPREVSEAIELSKSDVTIFTNLLQRRFLSGDRKLNKKLDISFKRLASSSRESLIDEILASRTDRYRRFYSTVYFQEPNVKESKGGLRDMHEAFWVSKMVFGLKDYGDLISKGVLDWQSFRNIVSAYDFMLRVRNQMHIISGRKSDILSFEMQPKVAEFFSFSSDKLGIERFMKSYFSSATDIAVISKGIIGKSLDVIREKKGGIFSFFTSYKDIGELFYTHKGFLYAKQGKEKELLLPENVMKGFKIVKQNGLELSGSLFSNFKLSASLNKKNYQHRRILSAFKSMLLDPKRLSYTLERMHECDILGALIPDFERLKGHFQFDVYHKFTTDVHSILTVREIEKVWEREVGENPAKETALLYNILHDIEKPHLLFIAALLHDIGKGKYGKHEVVGAAIARRYLKKLNFSNDEIDEISWLIRNHLLMSHLAFRRDISDTRLISKFRDTCETEDRLKKLFILTYADINAVGPGAWDRWKSSLMWRLYSFTLDLLRKGKPLVEIEAERFERKIAQVKGILKAETADEFLDKVNKNYILSYPTQDIAKHLSMIGEVKDEGFSLYHEAFPDIGFTKFTIVTSHRRGLFNKVAAIISYIGLNIKGANVNRIADNYVVYTVQVSTVSGESVSDDKADEFKKLLKSLYNGNSDVDLVSNLTSKSIRRNLPKPENKVKFDNSSSKNYTIIEISTFDRLGILYVITKSLLDNDLRLKEAIIATEGNRAIDSFYVTDMDYRKVTDEEKLEQIENNILKAIA